MDKRLRNFIYVWVKNDLDNSLGRELLASGQVTIAANGRVWFKPGVFSSLLNELQAALEKELGRAPTMGDLDEFIKNQ